MKQNNWKKLLATATAGFLCATATVNAQRFGGFGNFGRNNNFGGNNNSSQQLPYTPNGQVGSANISVDDSGNLVVIGDEETIRQIKQVVANMDHPQPQVLIKVVFLEVQHNNALDLGVEGAFGKNIGNSMTGTAANVFGLNGLNTLTTNFNAVGPATAVPALTQAVPGAGLYQILGNDFQATLRAIAQAGKAQLLSRPSILARDRQPATIVVGQTVPLITSVTFTGIAGIPVNNVTYQDVGIILTVTPFITPDGMVQMIVSPETSSIDPNLSVPISAGVNAPVIDKRSADTVAITPDGQTVVIGGLMSSDKSSSESKIPFLGDIPVLGNLFKRKTNNGSKTELLIFLTPHIVETREQLAAMSAREQGQNPLIKKSVSEDELDRFLERVPMKTEK